ncbi:polygalacturonase inhibitor 1-like [Chenopodium quinoa]|uniref:polygalacturonase inhibitor 1-like n=1 Tax=Chenopodium quinoa TaxID=63459 RepID=UPI000B76F74A|nr:polygalacturonase inhibitor 1-like [Chenopodium quinoa]
MEALPKISLLVYFIFFFLFLKPSQSTTHCNPNDLKVLLQIKNYFHNGPTFSEWNPKIDCCNWNDISCNDDTNPGRVTSLTVAYGSDVIGHIPPMVGDLPYLMSLRFFQLPNLTGPIPKAITKLTKVEVLDLSSNKLTGPIPDFLSQIMSLQLVDLSDNRFTGKIPSSLSTLPNLFELDIFRNKLIGTIPKSFGSFKSALTLQVWGNKLSGTIPRSLGHANLTILDVSDNKFTGDVSFLFARDKPLGTIVLRNNKFKFDFTNVDLPRGLKGIDMTRNKIYGSLPKRLGQLPLQFIDVSYNQLCGRIPTGRRLKRFEPFRFSHNKCLCGAPLPPCK